ncbi:MAG: hypothetical protein MI739_11995 [Bacteroidales bacterium]|nr:hypothetical protein [Bacteroidales bacterium]
MISKYNNLKLGIALGIFAPFFTMLLVYIIMFWGYNLQELIDSLISKHILTKIISLCVIPNLALFFLFLNRYNYKSARGILLSTILFAVFVFITKFII